MKCPITCLVVGIVFVTAMASPTAEAQTAPIPKTKTAAWRAYEKAVYDAIGPRWRQLMELNGDLAKPGTVRFTFSIMPNGHVEKIKTLENTSNDAGLSLARRAIDEVRIPPIPPVVLKELPNHRFVDEASFKIFP